MASENLEDEIELFNERVNELNDIPEDDEFDFGDHPCTQKMADAVNEGDDDAEDRVVFCLSLAAIMAVVDDRRIFYRDDIEDLFKRKVPWKAPREVPLGPRIWRLRRKHTHSLARWRPPASAPPPANADVVLAGIVERLSRPSST